MKPPRGGGGEQEGERERNNKRERVSDQESESEKEKEKEKEPEVPPSISSLTMMHFLLLIYSQEFSGGTQEASAPISSRKVICRVQTS